MGGFRPKRECWNLCLYNFSQCAFTWEGLFSEGFLHPRFLGLLLFIYLLVCYFLCGVSVYMYKPMCFYYGGLLFGRRLVLHPRLVGLFFFGGGGVGGITGGAFCFRILN